ncbi:unnamed protein product [Prorocentrum cordatum]|uniref:Uncharacterized protein n=1 Tax=Prorocentrum cordatum TaxID=2364126 RepID=A0ABN9RLN3_9DINO|nr:unnamed protein product [Polarella glacialis]
MKLVRARDRAGNTANSMSAPLEDWVTMALDMQLTCLALGVCELISRDIEVARPLVNLTVLKINGALFTRDTPAAQPLVTWPTSFCATPSSCAASQRRSPSPSSRGFHGHAVVGDDAAVEPLARVASLSLADAQVAGDFAAVGPPARSRATSSRLSPSSS